MTRLLIGKILAVGLLTSPVWLNVASVNAQIIELGEDVRLDFSNDRRRRTNVRVVDENGRLNIGVEEQRRPQTRVRLFGGNNSPMIDIRQERPEPEERVRLSIPYR